MTKGHGQTEQAIRRFWHPVLVSALNEDLDRLLALRGKVFRESFLSSAEAGRMGIPAIPLSELYGRAITYLEDRGGEVCLRHQRRVDRARRFGMGYPSRRAHICL